MKLRTHRALTALLFTALAPTAWAGESQNTLAVRMTPGSPVLEATAALRGLPNSHFALFATVEDLAPGRLFFLGTDRLDEQGRAQLSFDLPHRLVQAGAQATLQATFRDSTGATSLTNPAGLDCSLLLHEMFSFDYTMQAVGVQPGEKLSEQWAAMGMHMRAVNFGPGPDLAIAFDSSSPTGQDDDLATPGTGSGNDFAYENLMIVAEDDVDMDRDGLVDDPDDARDGGVLFFDWDEGVIVHSVTLVDVDESDPEGAMVRTYYDGLLVESAFVPGLDDNNVQTAFFESTERVDELQVEFTGSGAVAQVDFMPCPVSLTFDTTTSGVPFGYAAGTIVQDQWASEAVFITGVTNDPSHPDEVLIFDTAHPTGGDTDLVTPGYGRNNALPRGEVLVLADNTVDENGDGLVDNPGDSNGGGTFTLDFSVCSRLESATVLDIDSTEPDCFFEAFDINGVSLGQWPLAQMGDNSIQTVDFGGVELVRKLQLTICASGALVDVTYCPTPGADTE